jgi:hypothetical protein
MADDSAGDLLRPGMRARMDGIAELIRSATTAGDLRFAISELGRAAGVDEASSSLESPPAFDLHVHFVRPDAFPAEGAELDPQADDPERSLRERMGADSMGRLEEMESAILRRIEEDAEWAAEFAARPLLALEATDPAVDRELLERLREVAADQSEAFRSLDVPIRLVEIETADRVGGHAPGPRGEPGPERPDLEGSERPDLDGLERPKPDGPRREAP